MNGSYDNTLNSVPCIKQELHEQPNLSSSQSNVALPYTFRPANMSSSNLSDLFDLNEIFRDDFYPPDLDFMKCLPQDAGDDGARWTPGFETASIASVDYSTMLDRGIPVSVVGKGSVMPNPSSSGETGVILIPPTLPRLPPAPTLSSSSIMEGVSSSGRAQRQHVDSSTGKRNFSDTTHHQEESKASKSSRIMQPPPGARMSEAEYQRYERRERNREHAKRSRVRKKLLLDSLQDQLLALRQENNNLRRVVTERIPQFAAKILSESTTPESTLLASLAQEQQKQENGGQEVPSSSSSSGVLKPSPLTSNIAQSVLQHQQVQHTANLRQKSQSIPMKPPARILMEPDYRLIQSLVTSQQNFCLSDPSLPDNPIVYASDGFCRMTGYKKQDVLGRNCRFLQGPGTDQAAVELIRNGLSEGRDISVCLLNYKADGKPFWNQFFLAALKDAEGQIVNYVGVQCEVNNIPVVEIKDRVKKLPIPTEL